MVGCLGTIGMNDICCKFMDVWSSEGVFVVVMGVGIEENISRQQLIKLLSIHV